MGIVDWLFGKLDQKKEREDQELLEELVTTCHSGDLRFRRQYSKNTYCMLLGDNEMIPCPYRSTNEVQLSKTVYLYPCRYEK